MDRSDNSLLCTTVRSFSIRERSGTSIISIRGKQRFFLHLSNRQSTNDIKLPATDPVNLDNVNTELSVFLCPSTSNYTHNVPDVSQRDPIVNVGKAARSDYEAIGGVLRDPESGGFESCFRRPVQNKIRRCHRRSVKHVDDRRNAGRPDIYGRGEPDQPNAGGSGGPVGQPAWAIYGILWAIAISERHGGNDTNQQGLYFTIMVRTSQWPMARCGFYPT